MTDPNKRMDDLTQTYRRAMNKVEHRERIMPQVEAKRQEIKRLRKEAQELLCELGSEWVVRSRTLRQEQGHGWSGVPVGHESFHGVKGAKTKWYRDGFVFEDSGSDGVHVFSSVASAIEIAHWAAKRDRRYGRRAYVVEVVDRVDGEVFCGVV